MRTLRSGFGDSEVLRHAAALAFAVLVLLSCKLSEEIELREDGSGVYRAELVLSADEAGAMDDIKKEIAKKPALKIVDEGQRDGEHYLVLEQAFDGVAELNDDGSENSWSSSKAGFLKRSMRLELKSKPGDWESALMEHELKLIMPGKIVETNGNQVSGDTVSWDRVTAGSGSGLYIVSEALAVPNGVANGLWLVGMIALAAGVYWLVRRARQRAAA